MTFRSRSGRWSMMAAFMLAGAVSTSALGEVEVLPDEAGRKVDIRIDGRPFTTWIWPESLTKPVLFPVRTPSGTAVTRGFPLEPLAGERVDHPHHVGLWLSYGDVNGVDFWNNSSALPPTEQAKMGRQVQTRILSAEGGSTTGRLVVSIEWRMPDGTVALDEEATLVFGALPSGRFIDRTAVLSARTGAVRLADNKEGFIGMRVARWLEHPSREPLVLTDSSGRQASVPVLQNEGVSGLYRSSEGRKGDEVWGTRARWTALSGRTAKEEVTLAILDAPSNPGSPTYWHARGYGLFAANPLGQKVFSGGREALELVVAPGQKVRFRWRLLVLSAPFDAQRVEDEWQRFAEGR